MEESSEDEEVEEQKRLEATLLRKLVPKDVAPRIIRTAAARRLEKGRKKVDLSNSYRSLFRYKFFKLQYGLKDPFFLTSMVCCPFCPRKYLGTDQLKYHHLHCHEDIELAKLNKMLDKLSPRRSTNVMDMSVTEASDSGTIETTIDEDGQNLAEENSDGVGGETNIDSDRETLPVQDSISISVDQLLKRVESGELHDTNSGNLSSGHNDSGILSDNDSDNAESSGRLEPMSEEVPLDSDIRHFPPTPPSEQSTDKCILINGPPPLIICDNDLDDTSFSDNVDNRANSDIIVHDTSFSDDVLDNNSAEVISEDCKPVLLPIAGNDRTTPPLNEDIGVGGNILQKSPILLKLINRSDSDDERCCDTPDVSDHMVGSKLPVSLSSLFYRKRPRLDRQGSGEATKSPDSNHSELDTQSTTHSPSSSLPSIPPLLPMFDENQESCVNTSPPSNAQNVPESSTNTTTSTDLPRKLAVDNVSAGSRGAVEQDVVAPSSPVLNLRPDLSVFNLRPASDNPVSGHPSQTPTTVTASSYRPEVGSQKHTSILRKKRIKVVIGFFVDFLKIMGHNVPQILQRYANPERGSSSNDKTYCRICFCELIDSNPFLAVQHYAGNHNRTVKVFEKFFKEHPRNPVTDPDLQQNLTCPFCHRERENRLAMQVHYLINHNKKSYEEFCFGPVLPIAETDPGQAARSAASGADANVDMVTIPNVNFFVVTRPSSGAQTDNVTETVVAKSSSEPAVSSSQVSQPVVPPIQPLPPHTYSSHHTKLCQQVTGHGPVADPVPNRASTHGDWNSRAALAARIAGSTSTVQNPGSNLVAGNPVPIAVAVNELRRPDARGQESSQVARSNPYSNPTVIHTAAGNPGMRPTVRGQGSTPLARNQVPISAPSSQNTHQATRNPAPGQILRSTTAPIQARNQMSSQARSSPNSRTEPPHYPTQTSPSGANTTPVQKLTQYRFPGAPSQARQSVHLISARPAPPFQNQPCQSRPPISRQPGARPPPPSYDSLSFQNHPPYSARHPSPHLHGPRAGSSCEPRFTNPGFYNRPPSRMANPQRFQKPQIPQSIPPIYNIGYTQTQFSQGTSSSCRLPGPPRGSMQVQTPSRTPPSETTTTSSSLRDEIGDHYDHQVKLRHLEELLDDVVQNWTLPLDDSDTYTDGTDTQNASEIDTESLGNSEGRLSPATLPYGPFNKPPFCPYCSLSLYGIGQDAQLAHCQNFHSDHSISHFMYHVQNNVKPIQGYTGASSISAIRPSSIDGDITQANTGGAEQTRIATDTINTPRDPTPQPVSNTPPVITQETISDTRTNLSVSTEIPILEQQQQQPTSVDEDFAQYLDEYLRRQQEMLDSHLEEQETALLKRLKLIDEEGQRVMELREQLEEQKRAKLEDSSSIKTEEFKQDIDSEMEDESSDLDSEPEDMVVMRPASTETNRSHTSLDRPSPGPASRGQFSQGHISLGHSLSPGHGQASPRPTHSDTVNTAASAAQNTGDIIVKFDEMKSYLDTLKFRSHK